MVSESLVIKLVGLGLGQNKLLHHNLHVGLLWFLLIRLWVWFVVHPRLILLIKPRWTRPIKVIIIVIIIIIIIIHWWVVGVIKIPVVLSSPLKLVVVPLGDKLISPKLHIFIRRYRSHF